MKKNLLEIHVHLIDKLALGNAFLSGVALYPQLVKAILARDFSNLSDLTFFLVFINSAIWMLYALHRNLISLGVASVLNLLASGLILLFVIFLA